jgi:hypothetical protein
MYAVAVTERFLDAYIRDVSPQQIPSPLTKNKKKKSTPLLMIFNSTLFFGTGRGAKGGVKSSKHAFA